MDTMAAFTVLCFSLLLRLALPVAITFVLVYFLRKLDARWQVEGELQPGFVQKPECSKIRGCSPEQRQGCVAFSSPLPCWQVFRLPNGYLSEKCISCKVFIDAPIPALQSPARVR
jgi:hypothetical protein